MNKTSLRAPRKDFERVQVSFLYGQQLSSMHWESVNNSNNTDSIHVLWMKSAKEENKLRRSARHRLHFSPTILLMNPAVMHQDAPWYSTSIHKNCQSSRTIDIHISEYMQSGKLTSFQLGLCN